jgi:RimJ/RimL family protein N-acetyltransferase
MEVTFRRLVPSDAALYRSLRLEGLRLSPDSFTSTLEEESAHGPDVYTHRLAVSDNATIGALHEERLVGVGTIIREHRTRTRHCGDIVGMYVTPDARGAGVGNGIIERLIAHARKAGLRLVTLEVIGGNEPARRLYEKSGFRKYGHKPRAQLHDGAWLDTTLMALLLD